ncbi:MAG: xanthine dehydrogenase family protein molybdopterin-binding subunit [Pseudomonadales bacterium]|nr:xanthine dehydrogenase family protein molybdopterin-binding subunit [Pseudomonadales bacterium]
MTGNLSRRNFLLSSLQTSAGLMLGVSLPLSTSQAANASSKQKNNAVLEPNAFVAISNNNIVTITIKHLEMGQGTFTGLATLVAEELDAAWSQVECRGAEADAKKYANLNWGKFQGTGGSSAIANAFMQMREAGASARAMLVAAAAQLWNVPAAEISVADGVVQYSKSGKKASFGELAELAAQQPVPDKVTLKTPDHFKLIGSKVSRKDVGKTNGTAIFTQDIKLPEQLTAVVAHPPRFGARVQSFDASTALKVPGVETVVEIPSGIAVLAKDFWQAKKARDLLTISWDESNAFTKSTDQLMDEYAALAETPGDIAEQRGDIDAGFKQADKVFDASYQFPFLAHAPMEPLNCVVQIHAKNGKPDNAELWYGAQLQTGDQMAVAKLLGISPEQVKINTLLAGGSFGRRANSVSDYVVEATEIAKAHGKGVPIKLVWTRENDTQAGYFRPMYVHKLRAGVDRAGNIVAWHHRIVGQSIVKNTAFGHLIHNGIDHTSVEGAINLPYAIPHRQIELHTVDLPVPVLWWRSVGSTHTAFAVECFLDEVAHGTQQDPLQLRLALLKDQPRHKGVLELAAQQSGWYNDTSKTRNKGVALHKSFNTYVAQVVETTRQGDGVHIERVTCAVDCGVAVNPDIIKAQMEGGIGFGLAPALLSEINLAGGKVVQSNFHDYRVLRMKDMPKIDVHIVSSTEPPTGVGEPGTPVIAPALANSVAALTNTWEHKLPLQTKII